MHVLEYYQKSEVLSKLHFILIVNKQAFTANNSFGEHTTYTLTHTLLRSYTYVHTHTRSHTHTHSHTHKNKHTYTHLNAHIILCSPTNVRLFITHTLHQIIFYK